jgi:membrane protein YdbS with pleckstrin-like domain
MPPAAPDALAPRPPEGVSTADPFPALPVVLRPDQRLLTYYVLGSLLLGPAFFVALVPLYFRYHTLRYEVDDEGITARWGLLFRREVLLSYARIQDIHLTSNLVERWLGLAKVQVQTASGSAGAELTVEGMPQFEAIRDFLYTRMRGARGPAATPGGPAPDGAGPDELTAALRDVAAEVRALRLALAPPSPEGPTDG